MSLLTGIAAVALLALAGWWPSVRLVPVMAVGPWWARFSIALCLGAAIVGLVQIALSACGMPLGFTAPLILAAISVVLCRVAPATETLEQSAVPAMPRLLACGLLTVALLGSLEAVGSPFRSDAMKFWMPKSRALATSGVTESPLFMEAGRLSFHRDYPLLVPSLLAPVFGVTALDAAAGPKMVLHSLQLALLGLAAFLLCRAGSRGRWLLALLVATPMFLRLEQRESMTTTGFVEAVPALFLLLLVAGVDRLRKGEGNGADLIVAILAAGALGAAKLEGQVAVLLVLGTWLLVGPQGRPAAFRVGVGALFLLGPTLWIQGQVASEVPAFRPGDLLDVEHLVTRGIPVAAGLFERFLDGSALGLLPLLLVGWAIADAKREGMRQHAFSLVLVLGVAAFLMSVYLATTMHPGRHIHTSAHRLIFQWLPAFAFLIAQAGPSDTKERKA